MDPTTATIITKKALDIAGPHIKWFTDYMSFKMFGKEFFIEKAIAEAEAEVESKKVLAKWEFELNREKIWNDYILALEKAEKEVEYKNLISVMEKAKWKINENAEWNIDPDKMQRLKNIAKEYSVGEAYIKSNLLGVCPGNWPMTILFVLPLVRISIMIPLSCKALINLSNIDLSSCAFVRIISISPELVVPRR